MSDVMEERRQQRAARAAALASLADTTLSVREALLWPPMALRRCLLWHVLLRAPGLGPRRARKVCEDAGVWPLLEVAELTQSEAQRIVDHLPRYLQ